MWYKSVFEIIYPAHSNGGELKAVEGATAAEKAAFRFFMVAAVPVRSRCEWRLHGARKNASDSSLPARNVI